MAEVTREMILEYMTAKNGVVKNVDLVRHFRKHLQQSDPTARGVCVRLRVCMCACVVCVLTDAELFIFRA